jgi:hypothetical protein
VEHRSATHRLHVHVEEHKLAVDPLPIPPPTRIYPDRRCRATKLRHELAPPLERGVGRIGVVF